MTATPADDADLDQLVEVRLASDEHRYTRGRRQLVAVLARAGKPLTLPEIVDQAGLAQSSAYRNLDILEGSGIIRRLAGAGDHAHFELAEPLISHHHHLICVQCGDIQDVHLDDELEALVDRELEAAAAEVGFAPMHHSLDLHGRCATCQRAD